MAEKTKNRCNEYITSSLLAMSMWFQNNILFILIIDNESSLHFPTKMIDTNAIVACGSS